MFTLPGLKTLQQNPIYQRERGGWGSPNRYYANLSRYSPFIILGVIILGLCAGFNPAVFTTVGGEEAITLAVMLLCLPGFLLTMVTLYGSLMAPALTAPLISTERAQQTWDVLRTTPYSLSTILLAKLFGALSRLRIWPVLFGLTLFQGLTTFCLFALYSGNTTIYSLLIGLTILLRPWLELLFAAFAGMFFSVIVRSATTALAGAYAAVVLFKLFSGNATWLALYYTNADLLLFASIIAPTLIYAAAVGLLWLGIIWQSRKLADE